MPNAKSIVVSFSDGREEEYHSATYAAVALNVSPSTVRRKARSGESLLWNGQQIRFRYGEPCSK